MINYQAHEFDFPAPDIYCVNEKQRNYNLNVNKELKLKMLPKRMSQPTTGLELR
jgi:hypothetical protein